MYSVLFRIPHLLTKAKVRLMFAFPSSCSSYWCQWLLQWKWEILCCGLYNSFELHPRKVWSLPQKSYLCLVSSNKHSFRTQVHNACTAWGWFHMVTQCNNGSMGGEGIEWENVKLSHWTLNSGIKLKLKSNQVCRMWRIPLKAPL